MQSISGAKGSNRLTEICKITCKSCRTDRVRHILNRIGPVGRRHQRWTPLRAAAYGDVLWTGWVDMGAFLANLRLFESLRWRLDPIRALGGPGTRYWDPV